MPTPLDAALTDALALLIDLQSSDERPELALERFALLAGARPELRSRLVWEELPGAGIVQYDALLTQPGIGTASISFCPEKTIPWPLRGAAHVREKDLVRVDGESVTIEQAVALLDFIWREVDLTRKLVDIALIQIAERELRLVPEPGDLQREMDALRRANGLFTVASFNQWLDANGMTHETLERHLAGEAATSLLKRHVTENRIEQYFEERRAEFDQVRMVRLRFDDEGEANAAAALIRESPESFYEIVEKRFLTGKLTSRNLYLTMRRNAMTDLQADAIFSARVGDVVGPLVSGDGFDVIRVLRIESAELNEATRGLVADKLFAEWLDERRDAAKIDWMWGSV